MAQVSKMVDKVWQARLATGDPLDGLLHKDHVRVVVGIACNVDKLYSTFFAAVVHYLQLL